VVARRVWKCFLLQRKEEGRLWIEAAAAIAVDESDSAAGQVLLIGGTG
jgi:hypothetical protein